MFPDKSHYPSSHCSYLPHFNVGENGLRKPGYVLEKEKKSRKLKGFVRKRYSILKLGMVQHGDYIVNITILHI